MKRLTVLTVLFFLTCTNLFAHTGPNVALGKAVAVSSDMGANYSGAKATDGRVDTNWFASQYPSVITVDLGRTYNLVQVVLYYPGTPNLQVATQYLKLELCSTPTVCQKIQEGGVSFNPGNPPRWIMPIPVAGVNQRVVARYIKFTISDHVKVINNNSYRQSGGQLAEIEAYEY